MFRFESAISRFMDLNPIVLSIPIYFLLIGIELLIQAFSKTKFYRLNDAMTNISCGITQQLSGLFFKIFSIGVYQVLFENLALFAIPSTPLTIILLFILVDFAYYWAHRMSHEVNIMWGAHVVHHHSEDYNLSVALRQSSFQVFWTFAFYLPLAIIGFNTLDFALMAGLTTVYQFWIHTPVIKKMGWFEYIFNTPSHHRVHHGRDPKYIDRNHAGVFIIWDKMFGTFQKEEETPTYGITRPLNSWNPFWANFDHYAKMLIDLKLIAKISDKIKYLIKKPGWLPQELGGYQPAPAVEKSSYKKFDTPRISLLNYYVSFQYVLALALTAYFLFNQTNYNLVEKVQLASLIVVLVVSCGILLEVRIRFLNFEIARVLIYTAILIWVSFSSSWMLIPLITGVAYGISSLLFLTILKNRLHDASIA